MVFVGPGSDVAEQNPKLPKIGLTLPDEKVIKTLFGKRANFWQRFQSPVLNIFRDTF